MKWFNGARWRLSFSHCLEGLLIQIPVALLFGMTTGKKLEVEMIAGHDHDPVATWYVGWFPWTCDKCRQLDLYLPAFSSIAISFLMK